MDPYIVLGSAIVGLLVGMTGAGGGALMTPMLILLFSVKPSTAISSDLVAAVVMRPFGAAVHLRNGTVNLRVVAWMAAGSVPTAFFGAYLLHLMGNSTGAEDNVQIALGAALLAGTAAMLLRYALDRRGGHNRTGSVREIEVRKIPTVIVGMLGGIVVGITSVGSGSLMIVLLLFLYPTIGASQLVGTDLSQAVPLTGAAALGALAFGHVQFAITTSIVIGSVPAVIVGSLISSRAPDRYVRPAITFVIFASGLKYVGVGITTLGWVLCCVLLVGLLVWFATVQPWKRLGASLARRPGERGRVTRVSSNDRLGIRSCSARNDLCRTRHEFARARLRSRYRSGPGVLELACNEGSAKSPARGDAIRRASSRHQRRRESNDADGRSPEGRFRSRCSGGLDLHPKRQRRLPPSPVGDRVATEPRASDLGHDGIRGRRHRERRERDGRGRTSKPVF